jgi:hypothetical protein
MTGAMVLGQHWKVITGVRTPKRVKEGFCIGANDGSVVTRIVPRCRCRHVDCCISSSLESFSNTYLAYIRYSARSCCSITNV